MGPPRIILYSISFGNPDVDQVFSKIVTCVPHPTPEGEKGRGAAGPPRHVLSLPLLPPQAASLSQEI